MRLRTCGADAAERPLCQTWTDHEWGDAAVLECGRDAVAGAYHLVRLRCGRCGRSRTERRYPAPRRAALSPEQ